MADLTDAHDEGENWNIPAYVPFTALVLNPDSHAAIVKSFIRSIPYSRAYCSNQRSRSGPVTGRVVGTGVGDGLGVGDGVTVGVGRGVSVGVGAVVGVGMGVGAGTTVGVANGTGGETMADLNVMPIAPVRTYANARTFINSPSAGYGQV